MSSPIILAAATALTLGQPAEPLPSVSSTITYHRVDVDEVGIFYREAGPRDAPTVLLLHGYPSSSRQYDALLPLLADRYHVIAPDYPGFGQSDAPAPSRYAYTFDHLAQTIDGLVERLGIEHHVLFLQDYGGPVGFRMAVAHPDCQSASKFDPLSAFNIDPLAAISGGSGRPAKRVRVAQPGGCGGVTLRPRRGS